MIKLHCYIRLYFLISLSEFKSNLNLFINKNTKYKNIYRQYQKATVEEERKARDKEHEINLGLEEEYRNR